VNIFNDYENFKLTQLMTCALFCR